VIRKFGIFKNGHNTQSDQGEAGDLGGDQIVRKLDPGSAQPGTLQGSESNPRSGWSHLSTGMSQTFFLTVVR
jgi:hypothetical protein